VPGFVKLSFFLALTSFHISKNIQNICKNAEFLLNQSLTEMYAILKTLKYFYEFLKIISPVTLTSRPMKQH
jgi:hypothetical protein